MSDALDDIPHRLPHKIERTKNKHSRAVERNGTVIIRLARNLSGNEEQVHIQYLLKRMAAIVAKERARTVVDPFRPLLDGETSLTVTLASGASYVFELTAGKRTRSYRTTVGWRIAVGPRIRRAVLHRFLWKLLAQIELPRLTEMVHCINDETFGVAIGRVRIGYAATQWGSCSRHGDIMLNASLLFVPEPLLRYVIVHELAHRIVQNHSAGFWRQVERFLPAYDDARRQLRRFKLSAL